MKFHSRRVGLAPLATLTVGALALTGCSAGNVVGAGADGEGASTLTFLVDNSDTSTALSQGLVDAFEAANEGVTIKIESRPQGGEGDNVVKTRLSTGEMTDLFMYNTGSLFQALDPGQNLAPLDDSVGMDDVSDSFVQTVTVDDQVYGAPLGTTTGGGILYNKVVYEDLGLEVPTTWDEFMANNAEIEKAGVAPVIQTYQDTWTSQLFVLADYHNVASVDPEWAEKYTSNEAKYSDEPANNGFERLQEVHEAGYLNKDFASAKLDDGLAMLAEGKGAHYPMLTFALGGLYQAFPDASDDIGFFGLPGESAGDHGATVWTGGGIYIPKTTEGDKLELAQKFLDFVASPDGCEAQTEAFAPSGPYFVEGCELPADIPPAVTDLATYVDNGNVTPALEFLSPIKGPALEQICVEVGSGITSAAKGAALYDQDVEKQAQQLGLPGWD